MLQATALMPVMLHCSAAGAAAAVNSCVSQQQHI
jgi:hypothetical protein